MHVFTPVVTQPQIQVQHKQICFALPISSLFYKTVLRNLVTLSNIDTRTSLAKANRRFGKQVKRWA